MYFSILPDNDLKPHKFPFQVPISQSRKTCLEICKSHIFDRTVIMQLIR